MLTRLPVLFIVALLAVAPALAQTPAPDPTEVPEPIAEESPDESSEESPEATATEPPAAPAIERDPDARSVRYDIRVRVDGNVLQGEADIEIDPVGAAEMRTIVLFLFPNILSERLAGEDSRSYPTIHPKRFRRGGMQLTSLATAAGEALPWTGVDLRRPDGKGREILLPQGTAIRATLPEPATGTVKLKARFEVVVPERFGTFSWYEEDLFLTGGWYPMVAPRSPSGAWDLEGELPRVDSRVTADVAADHWLLLGNLLSPPAPGEDGRRTATQEILDRPNVLLAVADALYLKQGESVRVVQTEKRVRHARRIRDSADDALEFLANERVGTSLASSGGTIVYEAPLTRELSFHDAPVGVVSFRIYRVLPFLKRYHDAHVARSAIASMVRDRVYERESGEDAAWVLDAVTWHLALRWQEKAHEGMRDIRDYARPLSFLPAVDLVLNTPDFPFAAEYYDNWYFTDLVRDDITRFNHLRPNGRVAFEKLVDLVGKERAEEVMAAYLESGPEGSGLRATAERVTGQDLDWFFEQWRAPLPRVNYVLEKVMQERMENGEWISQIRLSREGSRIREPVQVRARVKGPDAEHTWMASDEKSDVIELYTKEKPDALELDFKNRLIETNRKDNRWPAQWRVLLQYLWLDYEFKLNTMDVAAGVQFERSNDLSDEIDLGAFVVQQSKGAQLGYVHSFGPPTFYRGLLHRIGAIVIVEDLDERFGKDGLHVVPGFDPGVSDVDATLGISPIYRYDSRDDWRFSRFGTRVFLSGEVGTSIKGPASKYAQVEAEAIHLTKLTDNNVFAVQVKGGTFVLTDPADVPLSKLFYLGGIDDVRGISAPDIVGPTKFVSSFEWRHFAFHNLDVNMWFSRMRQVQGALFLDTGYIAPRTDAVRPMNDWVTDVGYGFRLHYDLFGVRPMVFRADLAQRVDDLRSDDEIDVRLYIGAGQSF